MWLCNTIGKEVFLNPRLANETAMSFNLGNVFAPVLKAITPPPLVHPTDYDGKPLHQRPIHSITTTTLAGLEYRWKFFVFRPDCE
jgi:hypothetical protein